MLVSPRWHRGFDKGANSKPATQSWWYKPDSWYRACDQRDCFASLAMTPQMAVIARSGATKQSRCEARWRESSVWFRPLADGLGPALDSGEIGVDGFDPDGSGLSLASATKRLMSVCSPTIEVKTPRLSRCRASLAKQPSTALAQEHQVRVKWKVVRAKDDRSVSQA